MRAQMTPAVASSKTPIRSSSVRAAWAMDRGRPKKNMVFRFGTHPRLFMLSL